LFRDVHTLGGPLVTDAVGTSTLFCWNVVNTFVVMSQPAYWYDKCRVAV
jgi:hypothetical protein